MDAELTKLPRPSSSDPILEIIYKVLTFFEELKTLLGGTPDADGLVQTLRPTCEVFCKAIHATEPEFRPTDRRGAGMGTSMVVSVAAGAVNAAALGSGLAGVAAVGLAGAAAGLAENAAQLCIVSAGTPVVFLDDVTDERVCACADQNRSSANTPALRARSQELPYHYPDIVRNLSHLPHKRYIIEIICKWLAPAEALFCKYIPCRPWRSAASLHPQPLPVSGLGGLISS